MGKVASQKFRFVKLCGFHMLERGCTWVGWCGVKNLINTNID